MKSWLAFLSVSVGVPAALFAARRLVRSVTLSWDLPPFAPGALAGALALGLFLTFTALAGQATGRFDLGLIAAALVSIVAAALAQRFLTPEGPCPRAAPKVERRFALVLALLLALYANVSWRYQMHDEHAIFGHKAMVEQLRRDVYPPYFPFAPEEEARYHYGYDVLAGALARAYGASSDLAIDVVSMILVVLMAWAAAAVVCELGSERSAPVAAAAIHLGGGLAFILLFGKEGRHPRCLAQYHHPSCGVELFPAQFLNVFQHPVALGVPLALALVLLLVRVAGARPGGEGRGSRRLLAATLMVLVGAALGQFVYFALVTLAAVASAPIWALAARRAGASVRPLLVGSVRLLLLFVLALALAKLTGGMLATGSAIEPGLIVRRLELGFPDRTPLSGILWHHAVNLGLGFLMLPVLIAGSLRTLRERPAATLLLAFALGGIVTAHLFVYVRSWDIVKFPSAASFALSLLYVGLIDFALARRGRRALRVAGWVLLLGTGLTSARMVMFPLPEPLRLYELGTFSVDPQVERVIDYLHSHGYRSEERILAQSNVAQQLSVFGGLSVVADDADLWYVGIRRDLLESQRRFSEKARRTLAEEALLQLGVRYLVFSDEELGNLGPEARARLQAGEFELVADFPGDTGGRRRRVWRVGSK